MNNIAARTLTQLRIAFIFLTCLPIPSPALWLPDAIARSVWAFPLAGMVIGLAGALAGALGSLADLPSSAVALVVLAVVVVLAGGLHEDGLADTADGFGGGRTAEQKLAIMKDSRIGSFGALALFFSLGLRAAALTALVPEGSGILGAALIAAHAGSRSAMGVLMWSMPFARKDGLAAAAGTPRFEPVLIGVLIGGAAIMIGLGLRTGIFALGAVILTGAAAMALARRQIGGYTGDILGAVQQLAEVVILLAASRGLGN